jgi:hypothetical protein
MSFNETVTRWQTVAQQFGCIFDNLRFVEGEWGVSMVAVDPSKTARLRVANALLIPRDGLELTETGQRVFPAYCEDDALRQVLDEMLSYILNQKRISAAKDLYRSFESLPSLLKQRVGNMGLTANLLDLQDSTDQQIKENLIQARVIKHKSGKTVFMPFVDFINHHPEGIGYDIQDGAIVVQGKAQASGEVFAVYSAADNFHLLNTYFYPGLSYFAYSVAFGFDMESGQYIRIGRRFSENEITDDGLRVPVVAKKDNKYEFSMVWLGSKLMPRRPWWSFAKACQQHLSLSEAQALTVFSRILSFNLQKMTELLQLCDQAEPSLAVSFIKQSAMQQLDLLGNNLIELKQC